MTNLKDYFTEFQADGDVKGLAKFTNKTYRFFANQFVDGARWFSSKARKLEEQKYADHIWNVGEYSHDSFTGKVNRALNPMQRAGLRTVSNIAENLADVPDSFIKSFDADDARSKAVFMGNAVSSALASTPRGVAAQVVLGTGGGALDTVSPSSKRAFDRFIQSAGNTSGDLVLTKEESEQMLVLEQVIEGGVSKRNEFGLDEADQKKLKSFMDKYDELSHLKGAGANIIMDLVTAGTGHVPKLRGFISTPINKLKDYFPKSKKELVDLSADNFNNIQHVRSQVKNVVKTIYKANKDISTLPQALKTYQHHAKQWFPEHVQDGDLTSFKHDPMTDLYYSKTGDVLNSTSVLQQINQELHFTNEGRAINKKVLTDAEVSHLVKSNEKAIVDTKLAKDKEIRTAVSEYKSKLNEAVENYRALSKVTKTDAARLGKSLAKTGQMYKKIGERAGKAELDLQQKIKQHKGLHESTLKKIYNKYKDTQPIKENYDALQSLKSSLDIMEQVPVRTRGEKMALAKTLNDGLKAVENVYSGGSKEANKLRNKAKVLYNRVIANKFKNEHSFKHALQPVKNKTVNDARSNAQKTIKGLLATNKKAKQNLLQEKKDLFYKIKNFQPLKGLPLEGQKSLKAMKDQFLGQVTTVGPAGKTDTKGFSKLPIKLLAHKHNALIQEQYYQKLKQRYTQASQKLDIRNLSNVVANDLREVKVETKWQEVKAFAKKNLGSIYPNSNIFAVLSKTGKYDIQSTLHKVFKAPVDKASRHTTLIKNQKTIEINNLSKKLADPITSNIRIYLHQAKLQGLDVSPLKEHRTIKKHKIEVDNIELTSQELDLYNYLRDSYNKLHPVLNAFNKLYNNKDLGYIKNYAMMFVDDIESPKLDLLKNNLTQLFTNARPSAKASFFKTRKKAGTLHDVHVLATDNFHTYLDKALYLTQQVPVLRKLVDVLDEGSIAQTNPTAHKILKNYLEGQLPAKPVGDMSKFITYVKKNTFAMHLLGSVKLIAYQPFAYLLSAGVVKPTELPRFVADSTGFFTDFSKNKKFIDENMPDIYLRSGGEQTLVDLQEIGQLDGKLEKGASTLIKIADSAAAYPAAYGFYKQAKHRGYAEADAFNYAQLMVNKTQGSGFGKDVGSHLKNDWARLFLMFRTMTLAMGGTMAELSKNQKGQAMLFATAMFMNEAMVDTVKTVYNNVLFDEDDEFQGFGETMAGAFVGSSPSPVTAFELQAKRTFPDPLSDPFISTYNLVTDPSLKSIESFYKYVPGVPKVGAGFAFDIIEAITD